MTLTAHPARPAADFVALFGRGRVPQVVHAAADQPVTIGGHVQVLRRRLPGPDHRTVAAVTRRTGEALCGTPAPLAGEADGGLFPEPVTCLRCLAVAAAEHVTIGGGQP